MSLINPIHIIYGHAMCLFLVRSHSHKPLVLIEIVLQGSVTEVTVGVMTSTTVCSIIRVILPSVNKRITNLENKTREHTETARGGGRENKNK